jgi:hypothetical protein
MAYYSPQTHLREVRIVPSQAAVLFIDTQNFNCHREGACFAHVSADDLEVRCWTQQQLESSTVAAAAATTAGDNLELLLLTWAEAPAARSNASGYRDTKQ